MEQYLLIILAPLVGSAIVAFAGKILGNSFSALVAITGVAISFVLSAQVFAEQIFWQYESINANLYTWLSVGNFSLHIGILIDELTAVMMFIVTFISLLVHIYSIGYMKGEAQFRLFFSYISLFTFAMLMLVMSNNFMQLFFGWEAVGLVSYLLIGFYYTKAPAASAALKAFVVNRVGDFGFLLGIALVYVFTGSLDYVQVFNALELVSGYQIVGIDAITLVALLLFVGAMGKSAQFPLHIWLPGSMEGPTPISALIHAATMVTAGIFMVSRLSPLYELSTIALLVIMIIGGITALFMGLIGLVQTDIKKVIAYSTISQLGYMTVALGLSAYQIAIFHLFTHAFFKALLFLGAGSVIVALHHEQNIMKMGGLYKKLPLTFITFVIATLAIIGFPGFSGFYSKELIIEAAKYSDLAYAEIMYYVLVTGVFITTLYSVRLLILVFLGKPRDTHVYEHATESPLSITIPLVILAVCSLIAGMIMVKPIVVHDVFGNSIMNIQPVMAELSSHFLGIAGMALHAVETKPFYAMLLGIIIAILVFLVRPAYSAVIASKLRIIHTLLSRLYYIDVLINLIVVKLSFLLSKMFALFDSIIIDKLLVDGTSSISRLVGRVFKTVQTGYVYHYGFFMILGLVVMLSWVLLS